MSFQKKLSDVFNPSDASKNIYHSVEIRAAFVLEESTKGLPHGQKISKWLNLFTIMRFTPQHISNLSFEVPIDGPKVKFVTWNYPFENIWNRLIGGFASGTIQLDPITHQPYDPKYIYLPTQWDLLGQVFSSFPNHRENYGEEWPVMVKMFKTSSIDQARNIVRNDPEISRYIEGMNFDNPETALREFLHLNIPPDQTDNLHMIFEVPYKIDEIKLNRKNSKIVDLKVGIVSDGLDVKDLTVNIRQIFNSKPPYKASHPLSSSMTNSEKQETQNNLLMWEIKDQLEYDPKSQIEVDLFHKELGKIENESKNFEDFLDSKEKNSLSKQITNESVSIPEIDSGLKKFRLDYSEGTKTAFIMMQFIKSKPHDEILNCLKNTLRNHNITGLRADDKEYMDDLFLNIKTYMHACDFGIAVFERITKEDFNPNISLELGYMLGLEKNVLLLKDQTLKSLPSDLVGKLYKPFDTSEVDKTLPDQLKKWLSDKGFS